MIRLLLITGIVLGIGGSAWGQEVLVRGTASVIDGDTLRINGQRVRLWGVNAREKSEPGGPAATRAMTELAAGKDVVCVKPPSGQVEDRYKRIVGRCFVEKSDLAEEMVRAKQAVDWKKYSNGFYAQRKPGRISP